VRKNIEEHEGEEEQHIETMSWTVRKEDM